MSAKKVLVTGASGFIGSHLCTVLSQQGHIVTALVRQGSETAYLDQRKVNLARGDVTDPASLTRACAGQDWVFHTAAAVTPFGPWEHFRKVGVEGTTNLLAAATQVGAKRFIHLSSMAVYGAPGSAPASLQTFTEDAPLKVDPEPWNHYVREKVLSEQAVWKAHAEGKVQATTFRPSIVVGPRDRTVLPRVIKLLKSPLGALLGDGSNLLAVVVVEELADCIVKAAETPAAIGRAYNLSGREPVPQRAFLRSFADAAGLPPLSRRLPLSVAMTAVGLLENVHRLTRQRGEPFTTRLSLQLLGLDWLIDSSRAAADLGFKGQADYRAAVARSLGSAA